MIEKTCQWCGAPVSNWFREEDMEDINVTKLVVFACGVEWYENSGMHAWSRKPTRECGQRCAEQMRQLRQWRVDAVQYAVDRVTEGD